MIHMMAANIANKNHLCIVEETNYYSQNEKDFFLDISLEQNPEGVHPRHLFHSGGIPIGFTCSFVTNRIYNKILDHDWFFTHLFVT